MFIKLGENYVYSYNVFALSDSNQRVKEKNKIGAITTRNVSGVELIGTGGEMLFVGDTSSDKLARLLNDHVHGSFAHVGSHYIYPPNVFYIEKSEFTRQVKSTGPGSSGDTYIEPVDGATIHSFGGAAVSVEGISAEAIAEIMTNTLK